MKYEGLLFWTPIGILLLFLAAFCTRVAVEGFQEETDEQKLAKVYSEFATRLCPILSDVQEELKKDPDNATLPTPNLLQCPPLQDMARLPPTIGQQVVATIDYLNTQLVNVNKKLMTSLEASCKASKTEGFEDAVAPKDDTQEQLSEETRARILKDRLEKLLSFTTSKELLEKFARTQTLHKQMKQIQENPESVKSAC